MSKETWMSNSAGQPAATWLSAPLHKDDGDPVPLPDPPGADSFYPLRARFSSPKGIPSVRGTHGGERRRGAVPVRREGRRSWDRGRWRSAGECC